MQVHCSDDGRWLDIVLSAPPANVLTIERMDAIAAALEDAGRLEHLRAIRLRAEGPHFSYGASVHEHAPPQTARRLEAMGTLVRRLHAAPAVTIACVRGRCLGGGLELALACDRIVASPCAARDSRRCCPNSSAATSARCSPPVTPTRGWRRSSRSGRRGSRTAEPWGDRYACR